MISKKIKTPLYGTEFTVVIYNSEKEINDYFFKIDFNTDIENYHGRLITKDNGEIYLVLSAIDKGYPTPGIIAHESKHLVNEIFNQIGHHLDRYNDEPECYLLSWIVNRIHELNQTK
jgi:hypothetical protein